MSLIKITQAAGESIVSCSGSDCTVCSVLESVSRIYNVLTGLSFAAAVLFLTFAGLVFVFGIGQRAYFQKAKIYARNVIAGFIFVLVGWIAIHAVLYSTGYQNAGSWWQFSCETESVAVSQEIEDPAKANAYSNVADFIASGNRQGVIKEPIKSAILINSFKSLKEGEKLTFYLPAKKSGGEQEILVPFLAGSKSNGVFKLDEETLSLLTTLINNVRSGDLSLLSTDGSGLTRTQSNNLINALVSVLSQSILGSGSSSGLNLFGSSTNVDDAIKALSKELAKYESDGTTMGNAISAMTNKALENSEVIIAKSDKSSKTSSGDRSDTTSKEDKWKNTQTDVLKKNKDYNNLPSTQGENPVGPKDNVDKIKDKSRDDSKICDYSKATNPAEEALIRIECKDELRYNMIHRFVKVIHNTDFQGGFTEKCGEIAVNFTFPRELLDQIIMHEATHAGQFCLGLIDMSNPAKVEREACANQMGSLCREKHDENEGKGTDDYLMQEITCAGDKGKDGKPILCRQKPHITYKEVPAGTQDEEVRGYMSRWMTSVSPSGDLKCEAYDWPVKYALSYGDTTMGPYHYGAHACGENRVLGLKKNENEDVKTIVKSQEQCQSKARPNLPKAMECEESGGAPIEIDSSPKSPPGM